MTYFRRKKRYRAFTLPEMLISLSILGVVGAGVIALQILSARAMYETYNTTRSRSARSIAMNEIHFRLANAKRGSVVQSDAATATADNPDPGYYRIRFVDPNLKSSTGGSVTSEFYFDAATKILTYDDDVSNSPDPRKVASGLIYVLFHKGYMTDETDPLTNLPIYEGTDTTVTVRVQTSSELAYSNVDVRDGETVVYLNNE